jgi:hypothetical protein
MNAGGHPAPKQDGSAQSIVRTSIYTLLYEYIAAPLFNAREKDYQAVLFSMLRTQIPGQVPATFTTPDGIPNTRHSWSEPHTSRVHIARPVAATKLVLTTRAA